MVKRYLEALDAQLQTHQIYQRVENLHSVALNGRLTHQQQLEYKSIDWLVTMVRIQVEHHFQKLKMNQVQ